MYCTNTLTMLRELPRFLARSFSRSNSVTLLRHGSALGDVLMVSALARGLKKFRPGMHVAVVSRRPDLFENNQHVDENRGWHLWRSGYTVSAQYKASDLTLGNPHAVETQWRNLWAELTEQKFPGALAGPPALDGVHPEIFLTPAELDRARSRVRVEQRRPVVLLGSGGKLTPTHNREWGLENFQTVAQALAPHAALFQISGSERLTADGNPIPDLRDLSARDCAAVCAVSDAVLVQEGGLMHVARAVQAPCVTLFGGFVRAEMTGYADLVNFTSHPECSPCIPLRTNCMHLKCMVEITPRRVLAALAVKISERSGVALPPEVIEKAPDIWTPPWFVDRALLEAQLR